MARAREGERGPIWFVTTEQTAGRGRRHRPWIAPRGNLASSILEVIDVSPAVAATLGFAAGLALEAALRQVSIEASLRSAGSDDMKFALKWPNDVLAGGRSSPASCWRRRRWRTTAWPSWSASAPTSSPHPRARRRRRPRLRRSASDIGAEELFAALSDAWAEFRGIWDNGRGFGEIRRLWLERAAGLGAAGRDPDRRRRPSRASSTPSTRPAA